MKFSNAAVDALEVERLMARTHRLVDLRQSVQHPALQLGQLGVRHFRPLVVRQRAEHPAQPVAQLAVGVDGRLEDLGPNALVLGVVHARHPQAEDVGARLLDDVLRGDDVAERFRHLAPVLGHREAVGQHRVVGRTPARAARFEQGRVEPAAVLVRALQIEVGRPFQVRPPLQAEGVGGTRIEPHVEDVGYHVPARVVVARPEEARLGAVGEPGVGALGAEGGEDARVDLRIVQHRAVLVGEHRDGHTPGPLARQHPVGPVLDHAAQSVLAAGRHEARVVDGTEGEVAKGCGVGGGGSIAAPLRRASRVTSPDGGGGERLARHSGRVGKFRRLPGLSGRRRCLGPGHDLDSALGRCGSGRGGDRLRPDRRHRALSSPAVGGGAREAGGGGPRCFQLPRRPQVHRPVHRHEPLRGVAVDDGLLGAPRMRVGVLEPPAREQGAALDQRGDDLRLLASPFLPLSSITRAPSKPGASRV